MELQKGQNMIEHEAEIFARPARTWFQTSKEKQKAEGPSKASIFAHEFDMILIDLSKSLHEGRGKRNDKQSVVTNEKVAAIILMLFRLTFICLAKSG